VKNSGPCVSKKGQVMVSVWRQASGQEIRCDHPSPYSVILQQIALNSMSSDPTGSSQTELLVWQSIHYLLSSILCASHLGIEGLRSQTCIAVT
jgi:hypothetical protein